MADHPDTQRPARLPEHGALSLLHLLPWLWIPAVLRALRPALQPAANPPTLLVLRVFQRDAEAEALFDQVIERWRFTGNTVLIAGTDLVSRTLDPDDLFAFVNGQLAGRFITAPPQIAARYAEFDMQPDPDGRYRVNEFYCADATWQDALRTLVAQSDVVLMDLRGFSAANLGCRFELGVLAQAAQLRRIVLLHDARTDRQTAAADLAAAPSDRFAWVDAGGLDGAKARAVFEALFGAPKVDRTCGLK